MSATPADKLIPATLAKAVAQQATEPGTTPLREGRIYSLVVQAGYTPAEIADLVGATWNRVDLRIGLLDLCSAGQDALNAGTLPVGLAWYVSRLSLPNQRVMLARWDRGDFADAHQASDHAAALRKLEAPTEG